MIKFEVNNYLSPQTKRGDHLRLFRHYPRSTIIYEL